MFQMMQSLLIKLGMLALTMGVVFWIGWQVPQATVKDAVSVAGTEAISLPIAAPGEVENKAAGQSVHRVVAAQTPVVVKDNRPDGAQHGLLDLNRASAQDLESLPGVGAVLAQRVIDYRKSIGRFQAVEELREVKGIGLKKFDRIKSLVTVAVSSQKGKPEKRPS
jgi:competence protein ComEA